MVSALVIRPFKTIKGFNYKVIEFDADRVSMCMCMYSRLVYGSTKPSI